MIVDIGVVSRYGPSASGRVVLEVPFKRVVVCDYPFTAVIWDNDIARVENAKPYKSAWARWYKHFHAIDDAAIERERGCLWRSDCGSSGNGYLEGFDTLRHGITPL